MRSRGDLPAQRRHVWRIFRQITATSQDGRPAFETWPGEAATFGGDLRGDPGGIGGFRRPPEAAPSPAFGAPVVVYSLYNPAAFDHIRRYGLHRQSVLTRLAAAPRGAGRDRRLPEFPAEAVIVKTAWWPVAREGLTALPVWDPELNPPDPAGNPYIGWRRVVAVDPAGGRARTASVDFMGRRFPEAARVGLDAFHNVTVDRGLASRLAADPESARAAWIALGRLPEPGDHLLLVGLNLMTREVEDWVWGALWWHDRPDAGPHAEGRPVAVGGPWRNYLMQAAMDAERPAAADGSAHICFNPWLEGRFPDSGDGGGVQSNCMSCHERASFPATPFLPVTRGRGDRVRDPAFDRTRVTTSFLWSLALHSQAGSATH